MSSSSFSRDSYLLAEGLNFTVERLQLAFVGSLLGRELTVENTNLIAEELDSLLDLGQVAARPWRTCSSRVDRSHRARRSGR